MILSRNIKNSNCSVFSELRKTLISLYETVGKRIRENPEKEVL
jgi:hypothetical protein